MSNFVTYQKETESDLFWGQKPASECKTQFDMLEKDLYKSSELIIADYNPSFSQNEAKFKSGNFI